MLYVENAVSGEAKVVICNATHPDVFAKNDAKEDLQQPKAEDLDPAAFAETIPYAEDLNMVSVDEFRTPRKHDPESDPEQPAASSKRARRSPCDAAAPNRSARPLTDAELEAEIE